MSAQGLRVWCAGALCACGLGLALLCAPLASAAAPAVEEEWVTEVSATGALLHAKINAEHEPTTYRFEYATSEAALLAEEGTAIPAPPAEGEAGEGEAVAVVRGVQGLSPATTYYLRAVARNAHGEQTPGEVRSLITQPLGSPLTLLDGREWELVSPPEKQGMQMLPAGRTVAQAAEDGEAITYPATGPFTEEATGNAVLSQVLSRRGPDGWSSQDIAAPHGIPVVPGNGVSDEYVSFSSDLTDGLIDPLDGTPLSPSATEPTPYLRDDVSGEYTPLLTAANVLPGVKFGKEYAVAFVTATPSLEHVVLGAIEPLTAESREEDGLVGGREPDYYYEWTKGALKLIDVFPPNTPAEDLESVDIDVGWARQSAASENPRRAISEDGSRVIWSTVINRGEGRLGGQVYMRDTATNETVRVSAAQGVSEPTGLASGRASYQTASSDGSLVFFSDESQLTPTPGGGLYVYDADTGQLTLLATSVNAGEEAGVIDPVLGASEDGSYLYFVATGVLSASRNARNEGAVAGADNLYVAHAEAEGGVTRWNTSFIATLAPGDSPDWNIGETSVGKPTSSVSPNGRYLAFMSERGLTGYDNVDAGSGQRDEEVFLYDAAEGRLVCASCNPTGERPQGRQEEFNALSNLSESWTNRWVAASVPGYGEFNLSLSYRAPYQRRYLLDDGRVFFDSPDALTPQATGGAESVYEYEPAGVGSCAPSSSTFSAAAGGCVALISGGRGAQESVFVDASASGGDVFFATAERLAASDIDSSYDIYDAHVCDAQAPCPPSAAAVPPACDNAESCKPPPSAQPSIFGAPTSATFSGAGNLAPPKVASSPPKRAAGSRPKRTPARCPRAHRRRRGRCAASAGKAGRRGAGSDRRAGR